MHDADVGAGIPTDNHILGCREGVLGSFCANHQYGWGGSIHQPSITCRGEKLPEIQRWLSPAATPHEQGQRSAFNRTQPGSPARLWPVATTSDNAAPTGSASPTRRPNCVLAAGAQACAPNRHYAATAARRQRLLVITAWLSSAIVFVFIVAQLCVRGPAWVTIWVNLPAAVIFAAIPQLQRFGELVAPLTLIGTAYVTTFIDCWAAGTGSGTQLFYFVGACLAVLLLGIEHIVLAAGVAAVGVGLMITLEFVVPVDTGLDPLWVESMSFIMAAVSGCAMAVATVWYSLRETARAEAVIEAEYERSEALLANMLPASIADRLKDPARKVIADKYDNASVLFADIADFTGRASETSPAELIQFLNQAYTAFDALVDKYELEKIKVSGDSYMVVSGVPQPRPDHLEALACFALDMARTAAQLTDPLGRILPLRIGIATGEVVAGVVGSRRFFYDVWGDAVNVASRMESTGAVGRIHLPEAVYQRLKENFAFEERGPVDVKGKGLMHTWYLVGHNCDAGANDVAVAVPEAAKV
ncbi:MAG: adenylate/guanylate cyclase domain-containing protein [Mycobacteriaceae bacterium]|nr:adenylate/guanylate cyclase domain-containing protein [Mycobacteriaceae bacterium]